MRMLFLGLVLAVGCGKRSEPPTPIGSPEKEFSKSTPKKEEKVDLFPPSNDPRSKLPQTLKQHHGGRNAEELGRALLDANGEVSMEAAFALRAIGPESLRFVLDGFESPYAMVRLRSVATALNESHAGKYPEVFQPALVRLLSDEYREVRGWAALELARCGFHSSAGEIKAAMEKEKDVEVKRQMKAALDEIAKKK